MKWSRIAVVVLAVAVIFTAQSAFAGEVLDRIVERGEMRIGMTGDQPPLNVKTKTGEIIGYEVDMMDVLAAAMDVETKIVVKPFNELIPALLSGELDMIVSGMTITLQRNTKVAFVGPYAVTGKSILTKSSTLARADETDDINMDNIKLTALAGSTSQDFVEALLPKAKLTATKNYEAAIKMVLDDQADALVADIEACQVATLRHPNSGLTTLTEPLTIEPIGIALPPNDHLLVNLIENYFATLDAMGLFEALQTKWYEDGSWLIQVP